MKKYIVLSTLCLLIAGASFGQTRKIMHRSHSGKDHSLFQDEAEDNFGDTPEMRRHQDSIWNIRRDSIKAKQKADSLRAAPSKAGKKPVKTSSAKKKKK